MPEKTTLFNISLSCSGKTVIRPRILTLRGPTLPTDQGRPGKVKLLMYKAKMETTWSVVAQWLGHQPWDLRVVSSVLTVSSH